MALKMTPNSQVPNQEDTFAAFAEFASCPRIPLLHASRRQDSSDSNKNTSTSVKNNSGSRSPRPFSNLFNGLHLSNIRQLSSQSSTASSTNEASDSTSGTTSSSEENGKKLIQRGTFIMSSGRDKYTYDSETVELPFRSIDVYEKQYKQSGSTASSSPTTSPSNQSQFLHPYPQSPQHPSHPIHQHLQLNTGSQHSPQRLSPQEQYLSRRSQSQLGNRSNHYDNGNGGDALSLSPHDNKYASFRSEKGGSRLERQSSRVTSSSGSSSRSPPASPSATTSRRPFSSTRVKRASLVRSSKIELSKPVYVNGRYCNPWDTWTPLRFGNILKFGFSKDKSKIPSKEVSVTLLRLHDLLPHEKCVILLVLQFFQTFVAVFCAFCSQNDVVCLHQNLSSLARNDVHSSIFCLLCRATFLQSTRTLRFITTDVERRMFLSSCVFKIHSNARIRSCSVLYVLYVSFPHVS